MKPNFFFAVILAAVYSASASGQSCVTPIAVISSGALTGNTCSGSVQLPSLLDGAISNDNPQIVYRVTLASSTDVHLTLVPDASADMSMFVCPNQCSTSATCIAADQAGAGGAETVALPNAPGDYYVIVACSEGTTPACGTYTLSVSTPLSD